MMTGVIHHSDGTANSSYNASGLRMTNIAGKTGTSTMDITPSTTAAMSQVKYNDDGGNYDTAGIWFDGFSAHMSLSVGISRWTTINVDGKPETVQLPVDNIDGSGNDYGAMYPFSLWAKFFQLMQNTPYGKDTPFPTPTPNPKATVMNSPTPSATATTPTAPPTNHAPTGPATPTDTPTDTSTPTDTPTCQQDLFGQCVGTPTGSTSPSPTATKTRLHNTVDGSDGGG